MRESWSVALCAVVALILTAGWGGQMSSRSPRDARRAAAAHTWSAPPPDRVLALVASAGLVAETHETLDYHVHAHLDVFVNGKPQTVPAGIGIVITDPRVHSAVVDGHRQYGGISVPCAQPCISPLHTHSVSGVLHTESATPVPNTLGQFFTEWDVNLTPTCVNRYCMPGTPIALYANGHRKPLATAARIRLTDHKEIAIVIGRPPAHIPAKGDFSKD